MGLPRTVEILADPTHPEHDERREWLGREFDPESSYPNDFEHNLRNRQHARFKDGPQGTSAVLGTVTERAHPPG